MKAGETIAGKYRIERVLGEGGMGIVFEATHLQLDQRVAIKLLHGEALGSEEAVGRFAREARAAAKIQSEHVVKVFDVSTLESGAPYLVMEYLEGKDLDGTLRQDGPLGVDDAVTYVLQACEALAEAHKNGIVHRDLKPANLFVSERTDGSMGVKILDFGISKLAPKGINEVSVTRTSALMGSPLYMAPEQMRSTRNVDLRADIWSLGIILYELLVGSPPFDGETLTEVCAAIVADAPKSLSEKRAGVPDGLEAIVLRCLEKDPNKRFQDVLELATALRPFAPEQGGISVKRITRVLRRGEGANSTASMPAVKGPASSPELSASGNPIIITPAAAISQPRLEETGPTLVASSGQMPAVVPGSATAASFGLTGDDLTKPVRPKVIYAVAGGATLLLGVILVVAFTRGGSSTPANTAVGAKPPAVTAEPPPVVSAPVTSEPVPVPVPSPTAAPSSTATHHATNANAVASATAKPKAAGASAKPSTRPASSGTPSTQGFGGRD
jgi:serine/threonine protein kinase